MKDTYLHSIMKIWNFSEAKVIAASVLASIITFISSFSENYLGVSGSFGLAMAIVIIVDFITGVAVARKIKEKITSRKGLRSLYKTGAYMVFLYIAFSLKQELITEGFFQYVIAYFHIYLLAHICFWELFSIDENLKKLGIDLGLTDTLRSILNKLKSLITSNEKKDDEEDEVITYDENEGSNSN